MTPTEIKAKAYDEIIAAFQEYCKGSGNGFGHRAVATLVHRIEGIEYTVDATIDGQSLAAAYLQTTPGA